MPVPESVRTPGVYIGYDLTRARSAPSLGAQKALLIGYRTDAEGTATSNIPQRITASKDGEALFGVGSELDLMIKAAADAQPRVDLYAAGIEPPTGAEATIDVTLSSGPATATGQLSIWVGGRPVTTPIDIGDTITNVAANWVAAHDVIADMPTTASATAGVITITYRHDGLTGNDTVIRVELNGGDGILTTTPTALAGGTGAMDLTGVLAEIEPDRYHVIVCSENTAAAGQALRDHCNANADPTEQRGQAAIIAHNGTLGDAETLAAAINAGRVQVVASPTNERHPGQLAAAWAAVRAYRQSLNPGANMNSEIIRGLPSPRTNLLGSEIEGALHAGVAPLKGVAGNQLAMVRSVSTYTETAAGVPDDTILDTFTLTVLDALRDDIGQVQGVRFAQEKLTDALLDAMRSTILERLKAREADQWVEQVDDLADQVVVVRDPAVPGRANQTIPAAVVQNLNIIASTIELRIITG